MLALQKKRNLGDILEIISCLHLRCLRYYRLSKYTYFSQMIKKNQLSNMFIENKQEILASTSDDRNIQIQKVHRAITLTSFHQFSFLFKKPLIFLTQTIKKTVIYS